jgi:hypothetical protein
MTPIIPLKPGDNNADVANLKSGLMLLANNKKLNVPAAQQVDLVNKLQAETGYQDATKSTIALLQQQHQLPVTGTVDEATAKVLNQAIKELAPQTPVTTVPGANGAPAAGTAGAAGAMGAVGAAGTAGAAGAAGAASANGAPALSGYIYLDSGIPAPNLQLRLYSKGFGGADTLVGNAKTDAQGNYTLGFDPAKLPNANVEVRAVDASGKEQVLSATLYDITNTADSLNLIAPGAVAAPAGSEFTRLSADLTPLLGNIGRLADAKEQDERQDVTLLSQSTNWDARAIALAAQAVTLGQTSKLPNEAAYAIVRSGLPTDPLQLAHIDPADISTALDKAIEGGIITLNADQKIKALSAFKTFANTTRLATKDFSSLSTYSDFLAQQNLTAESQQAFANAYFAPRPDGTTLWQDLKTAGIADNTIQALQLQGKLGFLTGNNAPLVKDLQAFVGSIDKLPKLVEAGFYEPDAWDAKLKALAGTNDDNAPALDKLIPPGYTGGTTADRKLAYATDMAGKIRTTYPLQVLSDRIGKGQLPIGDAETQGFARSYLNTAAAKGFSLGETHLDSFSSANAAELFPNLTADQKSKTVNGMKLLQRVYQVSPDDESMQVLLGLGHVSAMDISRIPQQDFIERFIRQYQAKYPKIAIDRIRELGRMIFNRSTQITSTTYTFFSSVSQMQQTPPAFAISGDPSRQESDQQNLSATISQFPTLKTLFGSMNYCEVEEWRTVFSPAAYYVALLQFIDPAENDWQYFLDKWKNDHAGADYAATYAKPYDALTDRRPDLPNIPLTGENTFTALPYIDVVNEVLEYYLVNKKLSTAIAFNTGDATTAELLAEPQNIQPDAYTILKQAVYPIQLPFDLWLETVRNFCQQYDVTLSDVKQALQPVAGADLSAQTAILSESLSIAPAEWGIFTDADPMPKLPGLYGYKDEPTMLAGLKSASTLADRLGITYKELAALIQTRFINPELDQLVLLQKLSITAYDVFRYKKANGFPAFTADEQAAFDSKLASVSTLYGIDATAQLNQVWDNKTFEHVLLLNDNSGACNFDKTTVGYADKDAARYDWLRLNLFVRLWRKLGKSMEETDRLLDVFLPANSKTIIRDSQAAEADRSKALAQGLSSAIYYIARLRSLAARLSAGANPNIKLSTLWADIPVTGKNPLYAQLFLTRNVLAIDKVFDDALGLYLSQDRLIREVDKDHTVALQAALNLTAEDIGSIFAINKIDIATAKLTLANVSILYRSGLLAKGLKISIADLTGFMQLSGLNPFAPLNADVLADLNADQPFNQTITFTDWIKTIKQSPFKQEDLSWLFAHRFDPNGKYRNIAVDAENTRINLGAQLTDIQNKYKAPDPVAQLAAYDPFTDDAIQQLLALVLAAADVEAFFSMWTFRQNNNWDTVKVALGVFLSQDQFNSLFTVDNNADPKTVQDALLKRKAVLLGALLPYIQRQLISAAITAALAETTGATPERIQWLISDAARLHLASQPALALVETFTHAGDDAKAKDVIDAITLLGKVQQLADGFAFTDKELQYFIRNRADFENVDWSGFPIDTTIADDAVHGLIRFFIRLANYVSLREAIAGGGDDLIALFSASRASYDGAPDEPTIKATHLTALHQQLASLSRRSADGVAAVATKLGIEATAQKVDTTWRLSAAAYADERGVGKLWDVLSLVQTFGISIDTLFDATRITASGLTEDKYQAIAQDFKNAIKSRYEMSSWQQIAQPIFDKLRQRRRDSLVAYLLNEYPNLFTTMEEMYEYFLFDPGAEPVVQTSRLRLATSSVQLFIQRCLLNLETEQVKKVPPGVINAKYWEWMNRYQVWAANLKIFMWPEMFLEPEWRDDKTHLFSTLESKLVQADVSVDIVEDAFCEYLQKLEKIARMDITAMYCEEDPITPQANKLHVIGRTFSHPHQYFYRTYAQQMWTPWTPVDADIDGDHIVCVMWRGRLHLFWVTFIEKIVSNNAPSAGGGGTTKLSDWKVSDALSTVTSGAQHKIIEAHLHWSEYYQGQWSTRTSAGADRPVTASVASYVTSADIAIFVTKDMTTPIDGVQDGPVHINLTGPGLNKAFWVINKNCPPQPNHSADATITWPYVNGSLTINRLETGSTPFKVSFDKTLTNLNGKDEPAKQATQSIFGNSLGSANIVACSDLATMGGADIGKLVTPLFYQDPWHCFYVEPSLTETITVNKWDEWIGGRAVLLEPLPFDWSKYKVEPIFPWPKSVPTPKVGSPGWLDPDDPRIKVKPTVRQDWMTSPGTYVQFGDRVIGESGGFNVLVQDAVSKTTTLVKDSTLLNTLLRDGKDNSNLVLVNASAAKSLEEASGAALIRNSVQDSGIKAGATIIGNAGLVSTTGKLDTVSHLGGIFNTGGMANTIKNSLTLRGGIQ